MGIVEYGWNTMGIYSEQSQKQGLSHKMLQSAEILQMNAQELTELMKELS